MGSEQWVNAKTGEVGNVFATIRGAKYPRDTEFMTMFRDGWDYLSTLNLNTEQSRVLFKLLTYLDYENWIAISQETLAQELDMKQGNVARAIKRLVQVEVIEVQREARDKRRSEYRLNAHLGWKGDAKQWVRHIGQKLGTNVIPMPGLKQPADVSGLTTRKRPPARKHGQAVKDAKAERDMHRAEAQGQQRLPGFVETA